MKTKQSKWRLDPSEVHRYGSSSHSSVRKKASQSRALDITSKEWHLVHVPTSLEASGEIVAGHYSRNEMKILEAQLLQKLFTELERKVAKQLRVAGYE